jgi:hypothetical protein
VVELKLAPDVYVNLEVMEPKGINIDEMEMEGRGILPLYS